MDPRDVDSAADVRAGWDDWSYSERLEALDTLANATLDQFGYDEDVSAHSEYDDDHNAPGYYDDGDIYLDASLLENPDPDHAIHVLHHEMVHAMNDQDGIDDDTSWLHEESTDFDFTSEEAEAIDRHSEAGDLARALDYDGAPAPVGGGPPVDVGPQAGSEYEGASDAPQNEDLSFDIDWASGVWIDTIADDGSMSVEILFSPTEGW